MKYFVAVAACVAVAIWWLSRAETVRELPDHVPDVANGEAVFWAGGCASCHATPVDGRRTTGDAKLLLGGGLELDTPFGLFRVPNISPDEVNGIGAWSDREFVSAMQLGTSPSGAHYYPSFPYASYVRMPVADVLDLKAYLDGLNPVDAVSGEHDLPFPLTIRRGLGFWKRLFLSAKPFADIDVDDPVLARGQSLVEGVGHCGECHTPRNAFGAMDADRWLMGARNPDGEGMIPDITPGSSSIGEWSAGDLAYYFESGFTPDFDTVGGSMVAVQENLANLSADDRLAIAKYLKAL